MKNKKGILLVIILLLLTSVFIGFDWDAFANVRNVDIVKIFVSGMLTGVLIITIKDIIRERNDG